MTNLAAANLKVDIETNVLMFPLVLKHEQRKAKFCRNVQISLHVLLPILPSCVQDVLSINCESHHLCLTNVIFSNHLYLMPYRNPNISSLSFGNTWHIFLPSNYYRPFRKATNKLEWEADKAKLIHKRAMSGLPSMCVCWGGGRVGYIRLWSAVRFGEKEAHWWVWDHWI